MKKLCARNRNGFLCFLYVAFIFFFLHIYFSLSIHSSFYAFLLSHHPPREPASHQSCAASRLILPSAIIVGLNYWACQPPSGEPFVMWTGLDRTEQAYLGLVWGERDTQICVPHSVPVRPSVCPSGNILFFFDCCYVLPNSLVPPFWYSEHFLKLMSILS